MKDISLVRLAKRNGADTVARMLELQGRRGSEMTSIGTIIVIQRIKDCALLWVVGLASLAPELLYQSNHKLQGGSYNDQLAL